MNRTLEGNPSKVPFPEHSSNVRSVEVDHSGALFLNTGKGPPILGLDLIGKVAQQHYHYGRDDQTKTTHGNTWKKTGRIQI